MMKQLFIYGMLLMILSSNVTAQGTLVFSNLEEPTQFSETIAYDSWLALDFQTGNNPEGYRLNSVSLSMGEATGNPTGFSIAIYEVFGRENDTITKISDLTGSDPAGGGVFSYEAAGLTLAPSTYYSVVVTAGSLSAEGSYFWNVSDTQNDISDDTWFFSGSYDKSSNGSDWSLGGRQHMQYAIQATAIPEPSTVALVGTGIAFLAFRWWRQKKYSCHLEVHSHFVRRW